MQDRRRGNQERVDERTADAGGMTVLKYPGREEEEDDVVAEGFAFFRPTNSSTDDVEEEAEDEEVFLLSIGPNMPWRRRKMSARPLG
ncbi:hypothetical protein MUK42_24999 [Musa troglodytarum]|uniref:Uncharacterized protein n=1 Tax=Musa troglodytarum TaxID=320322 RepID=A0A9E7I5W3_9LILI|nr:hypothetical protein MUK42_24999 [Musa troglodytarum]